MPREEKMKSRWGAAIVVVVGLMLGAGAVQAQPNEVTLQGVLRTANGVLVNGTYDMKFHFYESANAPAAVFTETIDNLPVENGLYNAVVSFGGQDLAKDHESLWLGVEIVGESEFPRVALTSVVFALRSEYAAHALGVSCSGCIEPSALGFTPVTQEELAAGDLEVNGTVNAVQFVGDGSKLTGITSPQGSCQEGWFIAGIDADGKLDCMAVPPTVVSVDGLTGGIIDGDVTVTGTLQTGDGEVCTDGGNCGDTLWQLSCAEDEMALYNGEMWTCATFGDVFDPDFLPADGIDEISNDLLHNQFLDTYASQTAPVPVKDQYPPGTIDEIVVPDVGLAQTLNVTISVTNSDISTVKIYLYDPEGTEFVLYNQTGEGEGLDATYPTPDQPFSGDLTAWVDKNPAGTWILKVVDGAFLNNGFDGAIESWSIKVQTLSSQKVQLKGNLIVDGNISSSGGKGISIDDEGNTEFSGYVRVGSFDGECTAEIQGSLRYDSTYGLEVCAGSDWVAANSRPVLWRGYCNHHGTAHNWNTYCLSNSTHNTAEKYLDVGGDMVTFKIGGWYRVDFWAISNTNGYCHIRMYRRDTNNSDHQIYYSHEYVANSWDDNTAQIVYQFDEGEKFWLQLHNPPGGNEYAYHHGSSNNTYGGMTVTYLGPEEP